MRPIDRDWAGRGSRSGHGTELGFPAPAGVAVTVDGHARASRDRAFYAIAPIALDEIFTGYGPLPAVAGTRAQSGEWDHVGATRVVELADGSEAREQITSYQDPAHFGYRLTDFSGAMHLLVGRVDGAWWFTDNPDGGTDIRWTYTLQPRPLRATLIRAALAPLWRRYALQTLRAAINKADALG